MAVHLYALSTCPYCRMTKKYLDEHEVAYEMTEVDLLEGDDKDAAVAEVVRLSGGKSFPVLDVDGAGGRRLQQGPHGPGPRPLGGRE